MVINKLRAACRILIQFSFCLEKVLLSSHVFKYNHRGKKQQRILIITSKHIFNVKPPSLINKIMKSVKRKISLVKVTGVTVSRMGFEFVIHVPEEYDYRYSSAEKYFKDIKN